jgi:hypothetical protein
MPARLLWLQSYHHALFNSFKPETLSKHPGNEAAQSGPLRCEITADVQSSGGWFDLTMLGPRGSV